MADTKKIAPDTRPDGTEAARNAETSRTADTADTPKLQDDYRVLDVRADDVVLEMEDGRAFIATIKDGVSMDDVRRGMRATITSDGFDRSDAPKDAVVTKFAHKND